MYLLPSTEEIWHTRKKVTPECLCITLYIPLPTLIKGITLAEVWPNGARETQENKITYHGFHYMWKFWLETKSMINVFINIKWMPIRSCVTPTGEMEPANLISKGWGYISTNYISMKRKVSLQEMWFKNMWSKRYSKRLQAKVLIW